MIQLQQHLDLQQVNTVQRYSSTTVRNTNRTIIALLLNESRSSLQDMGFMDGLVTTLYLA